MKGDLLYGILDVHATCKQNRSTVEMRSCVDARRRDAYCAETEDDAAAAISADSHIYSISRRLEHVTRILTSFPQVWPLFPQPPRVGEMYQFILARMLSGDIVYTQPSGKRPLEEVFDLSLSRPWNSRRHLSKHLGLLGRNHLAGTRSCLCRLLNVLALGLAVCIVRLWWSFPGILVVLACGARPLLSSFASLSILSLVFTP